MIKFAKNVFRKIKGDNLNMNSYVNAKEIYEAKVHLVKTFITNIADEWQDESRRMRDECRRMKTSEKNEKPMQTSGD